MDRWRGRGGRAGQEGVQTVKGGGDEEGGVEWVGGGEWVGADRVSFTDAERLRTTLRDVKLSHQNSFRESYS